MPTYQREDGKPVVQFEPQLEISPFFLFRQLRDGRGPLLVDARPEPGSSSLAGAEPYPGGEWEPPNDRDVVLFDDDGQHAVPWARHLQEQGFERVRALFGGLELYEMALDPEVVGGETFLVRRERGEEE